MRMEAESRSLSASVNDAKSVLPSFLLPAVEKEHFKNLDTASSDDAMSVLS